jgi:hypothetical protein
MDNVLCPTRRRFVVVLRTEMFEILRIFGSIKYRAISSVPPAGIKSEQRIYTAKWRGEEWAGTRSARPSSNIL